MRHLLLGTLLAPLAAVLALAASGWFAPAAIHAQASGCTPLGTINSSYAQLTSCSLSGGTITLSWSAGGSGQYYVWLGSSEGGYNYQDVGPISTLTTTQTGMPTTGLVYVRLWSLVSGTWVYNDYSVAQGGGGGGGGGCSTLGTPNTSIAQLTSCSLSGGAITLSWSAGNSSPYYVWLGSGEGGYNYADIGPISTLTTTQNGMPTTGTVYVRLWTYESSGYLYNDYSVAQGSGSGNCAAPAAPCVVPLAAPADGAPAVGTTPTLSWSAPSGAVSGTTSYIVSLWNPFVKPNGQRLPDLPATTSLSVSVPTSEGLQNGLSYSWAVSACNGTACSPYPAHWFTFTTAASPGTPTQSSPSNGASGQSPTLTLSWTASSNAINGQTIYTVSVWDPYGGPGGHFLGDLMTIAPTTSIAVPTGETLLWSQTYDWNVTACNGQSCSGYNSQWFSFTTAPQPAATLSGATMTEVPNGDFSGAAIGATSVPGWTGSFASVAYDSNTGIRYVHDITSLTSSSLSVDFPSTLGPNGQAITEFRIMIRTDPSIPTPGAWVYWCTTQYPAPQCAYGTSINTSGAWEQYIIPAQYFYGSSGDFVISGAGLTDVGYLERIDGPAGRAGTDSPLLTGAASASATDLSVQGISGPLNLQRVYNSTAANDFRFYGSISTPFGEKWSSNWSYYLYYGSGLGIYVATPQGTTEGFSSVGGVWAPYPGNYDKLVENSASDWTLTTPDQVVYHFVGCIASLYVGQLVSIADRNGNQTNLTYDGACRLSQVADTSGRSITLSYGIGPLATGATDNAGHTVSYGYDSSGDLTSVQDVRGKTTSYAYTGQLLTSITDPNGHIVLTNTYDNLTRLATSADAYNNTTTYTYASPGAGATKVTDPRGNATTYYYDAGLRVTDELDAYGNDVLGAHDSANNLVATSAPLGRMQVYTYDANGNVLTQTDAENFTWTFTYDSLNDPLTATDPNGHRTTATYDVVGNLSTLQDAAGDTTTYTVNRQGQVTAIQNPRGYTTTKGYDPSTGDLLTVSDPLSHTTTYTYDPVGRPLTVQDANGHTTTTTYDAAGNVLTVTDALNHVTTTTYDNDGHKATVTDANDHETQYAYDNAGRLLTVTDANNGVTSYGYDAAGNRTTVTDANGKTTSYTFDNDERPLTETDPKSSALVTLTYDAAGRTATSVDARGITATYSYSLRDEVTGISYSDSTPTVGYTFDPVGNRTQMSDGTGLTTYTYDGANRLTSVTQPGGKTVSYGYDADGNHTSVTYPGGSNQVTYTYDTADRLTSLTDWQGNTTSYSYDPGDRLTGVTLPTSPVNTNASYTYDTANRLTGLTWSQGSTTLFSATYGLDNDGNRTSTATSGTTVATPGTESYTLDGLNRLTGASYPGGVSATYTYDKVGNRQSLVVTGGSNPGTTSYGYDATDPNRLTSVTPPGSGMLSYNEDADGNTTSRGGDTLTWNAVNELTSASLGGQSFSATYNGDGQRMSRTGDSTTTSFVWSGGDVIDDGTQYVYGMGLVEHVTSGGTYFYLADGSGSTVALVNTSGTVVQSYGYDAYGNVVASSGTQSTEYQYNGQQTDNTGLQYLRARYYDPTTGRFLSRDPKSLADPAAHNPYTFAGDNPATMSDPSGLDELLTNPCICGRTDGTYAYTYDEMMSGQSDLGSDAAYALAIVDGFGGAAVSPGLGTASPTVVMGGLSEGDSGGWKLPEYAPPNGSGVSIVLYSSNQNQDGTTTYYASLDVAFTGPHGAKGEASFDTWATYDSSGNLIPGSVGGNIGGTLHNVTGVQQVIADPANHGNVFEYLTLTNAGSTSQGISSGTSVNVSSGSYSSSGSSGSSSTTTTYVGDTATIFVWFNWGAAGPPTLVQAPGFQ